jgi:cyclic pyranopterin phosphate synthase
VDGFGRIHDYVRVAVNERCNLRCIYCMPADGLDFRKGDELLSTTETLRVIRVLAALGVQKVRFTGGEPLLRRDLDDLVAGTAAVPGITSVHLTTNGLLLPARCGALRDAGLTGVNISLDTLDAARFLSITRRTGLERVLESVRIALETGFTSVKVNVVALRGFNGDELAAFAELTRERPLTVRFIELMPFDAHQVWKRGHFLGAERIVAALRQNYPDLEEASGTPTEEHVFRIPGAAGKVAVIPAYTRSLCGTCRRLRVTANGRVRNCLYSTEEFDLMQLLRSGCGDAEIAALFHRALRAKLETGWDAQKRPPGRNDHRRPPGSSRESMTLIGG